MTELNWPDGLKVIVDVIGQDATLRLCGQFGGLKGVYIPRDPTTENRLSVIGTEAWGALCEKFGGRYIDIPRGTYLNLKKARIFELAAADPSLSQASIALQVGVTQRYVTSVLSSVQDPRQLDLFSAPSRRTR